MKYSLYLGIFILYPWFLQSQTMDVGAGAVVTIAAGTYMGVGTAAASGTVTTAATTSLVIQSTSSGTGSLICGGTPLAAVQRYLPLNGWHLVTPSTTGITANTFFWSHSPECWLSSHSEPTNLWTYNTDLSTPMPVGQGWTVWVESNATATMSGTLRTTDLSPSITYSGAELGWNLVGNPFPSAIDFHSGSWTMTNLEQTIWIWNNATNGYLLRTSIGGGTMANGIIPVSQGFFVHANGASPALTIPAGARTHNTQAYYKNSNEESGYQSYITLKVNKETNEDEVWISFGANGTTGFENGWDASKLFGSQDAPQLYLLEQNRKLSIDHLPVTGNQDRVVAMGFIPGIEGEQTITASLEHYAHTGVTLEDLKTGQLQNLSQNPLYTFDANKQDNPDRFRVHFKSTVGLDPEAEAKNSLSIYCYDKTLVIRSSGEAINQAGLLKIFDLCGQLLLEEQIEKGELMHIPLSLSNTYLIVQLVKPIAAKTQKIFIK